MRRWQLFVAVLLLALATADEALDGMLSHFSEMEEEAEVMQLLDMEPQLVSAAAGGTGTSALIEAAKAGHTTVSKLLLDRGATVNHVDNKQRSALLYATICANQAKGTRHNVCPYHLHTNPKDSHLQTMHVLLENGADASLRDNHGRAALHYAALSGHKDVVEELLGHPQARRRCRSRDGVYLVGS